MDTPDKLMVIAALVLGIMDAVSAKGPFGRYSLAGIAIVLLAIVELHRGGVINY